MAAAKIKLMKNYAYCNMLVVYIDVMTWFRVVSTNKNLPQYLQQKIQDYIIDLSCIAGLVPWLSHPQTNVVMYF